jgi:hypothetical protein
LRNALALSDCRFRGSSSAHCPAQHAVRFQEWGRSIQLKTPGESLDAWTW